MEDFVFKAAPASLSNLEGLTAERSIITEQRLLELSDIAYELALVSQTLQREGLTAYELLSILSSELDLGNYRLSELNSAENSELLRTSLINLGREDKAVFTELYLSHMERLGARISERHFLPEGNRSETFTYVRNPFSDEAYDVFSQDFSDPRIKKYSSSFKECVAAIDSGEVTYCLLPFEEKGGVRLPSISELIFRADLKINSVTPVFGPDAASDMKYALVSKHFIVQKKLKGDDRYLELRVGIANSSSLQDIILALDYFSMSVYRINTVSFDNEGETDSYYSLVIRDGDDGFVRLLTYLTLFCEDFVPVGLYKNLE